MSVGEASHEAADNGSWIRGLFRFSGRSKYNASTIFSERNQQRRQTSLCSVHIDTNSQPTCTQHRLSPIDVVTPFLPLSLESTYLCFYLPEITVCLTTKCETALLLLRHRTSSWYVVSIFLYAGSFLDVPVTRAQMRQ